jgi:NAD(P)H dehydrogenase (quinone)
MNVFIVYAHPSDDSFTRHARDSFIKGLEEAGHTYVLSDLYKMRFCADISESEYLREANYNLEASLPEDVLVEQAKINSSDAIVFIYPVFWTEAPAKLVGWFDRVWTYGFAYAERKLTANQVRGMKQLEKALVICVAGHGLYHLKEYGHLEAMKTIMLGDRIFDRAKVKNFIVLDAMSKYAEEAREANWDRNIETAYKAGRDFYWNWDKQGHG